MLAFIFPAKPSIFTTNRPFITLVLYSLSEVGLLCIECTCKPWNSLKISLFHSRPIAFSTVQKAGNKVINFDLQDYDVIPLQ